MEIKQIFEKTTKPFALRLTESEKKIAESLAEEEKISVNDVIRMSILYFYEFKSAKCEK